MDRRVRKVIELLDEKADGQVRVSELASRVGLGPSRLEHLFKFHAKTSIRDFVRERRLEKAAEMLRGTNERISAIGEMVGFNDPSNFNHAFKKRYGVTPRAFREEQESDESSTSHQETAEDTN